MKVLLSKRQRDAMCDAMASSETEIPFTFCFNDLPLGVVEIETRERHFEQSAHPWVPHPGRETVTSSGGVPRLTYVSRLGSSGGGGRAHPLTHRHPQHPRPAIPGRGRFGQTASTAAMASGGAAGAAEHVGNLARVGGAAYSAAMGLATIAGCGYVSVCTLAFVFQRRLQYFPTKEHPPRVTTLPEVCQGIEEFSVRTEDGLLLQGWHWPAPPSGKHAKVSLLQLHGNAGSRHNRLYWAHHTRSKLGCAVTLLDYRGYGGSEGSATESGMIKDGKAGIQWAATRAAESGSKLVLHLESIGSAAGLNAAAGLREGGGATGIAIAGIVVEGGLSSCVEIAQKLFSFLPLTLLMKDKWDGTCAAATSLDPDMPFMSMHGDHDEIVPLWCGRKLFDSVQGRKVWKEFKRGGHNNLMEQPGYFEALDNFYTDEVGA